MAKKSHDITPDLSLMPKLGQSGYSSPQAIAELVDNSIDARINGSILEVNIKIDKNAISVADNGIGMNEKILANSLTLAHSKKNNMLGEFGLGLKTACNSLGRRFEVISSPEGDNKQYSIVFDQEEWLKKAKKKWEIDIESLATEKSNHFTIVKIEKLVRHSPQLAVVLKRDFERRFAPFIERKEVNIKVNGKNCNPRQHELIKGSKKEFEIIINEDRFKNQKIYGWYGLLKEGSNKGLYGFHTYRRGRMITTYDKIAIGEHPTISRIIGEIHMDFVPVTHNKKEFEKESEIYLTCVKYLIKKFKELLKEARKKSGQDKITKNVKNELDIWEDKISQAVKTPDLKYYTSLVDPKTGMIKSDEGEEEDLPAEKREKNVNNKGTIDPQNTDQIRMPKKENENKKKTIKVKGKTFEFEHVFSSLGQEAPWKQYDFDKKKRKLVIYTNTDFPAYMATKDHVFYAVLHIAESISEVMVNEAGEEVSNVQDVRETILRVASNLKVQIY